MIPTSAKLRIVRATDNFTEVTTMYINGLGFRLLGYFDDHNGFDGVIVGHEKHHYHLEFTHHRGTKVGNALTKDNVLVFYFSDTPTWDLCYQQMLCAGFKQVNSYNDYWDVVGKTFEYLDGYRVVLQNREWSA